MFDEVAINSQLLEITKKLNNVNFSIIMNFNYKDNDFNFLPQVQKWFIIFQPLKRIGKLSLQAKRQGN